MKWSTFILILLCLGVRLSGSEDKLPDSVFTRLETAYPTFKQVVHKTNVGPLVDVGKGEALRLIENNGWGMRVITITLEEAKQATVEIRRVRPGKPDVVEKSQTEIPLGQIAVELKIIRDALAFREQERANVPPVIDGESYLVEVRSGLAYKWFYRSGFAGGSHLGGQYVLAAFITLENKVGDYNRNNIEKSHL